MLLSTTVMNQPVALARHLAVDRSVMRQCLSDGLAKAFACDYFAEQKRKCSACEIATYRATMINQQLLDSVLRCTCDKSGWSCSIVKWQRDCSNIA